MQQIVGLAAIHYGMPSSCYLCRTLSTTTSGCLSVRTREIWRGDHGLLLVSRRKTHSTVSNTKVRLNIIGQSRAPVAGINPPRSPVTFPAHVAETLPHRKVLRRRRVAPLSPRSVWHIPNLYKLLLYGRVQRGTLLSGGELPSGAGKRSVCCSLLDREGESLVTRHVQCHPPKTCFV